MMQTLIGNGDNSHGNSPIRRGASQFSLQWASVAQQQIDQTEQQLLQSQNELSTGKKVNVGSDDPGAADMIMQLNQTLTQRQAYSSNLNTAQSQLSEVDSTLGSVTNLIQQAQQVASADVNSSVSDSTRKSDADVVQNIYEPGAESGEHEFRRLVYFWRRQKHDRAVRLRPGRSAIRRIDHGPAKHRGATARSFPCRSAPRPRSERSRRRCKGTADLTPSIGATTRIIDLGGTGGSGVQLGEIQIGNGVTSKIVDLSGADSRRAT